MKIITEAKIRPKQLFDRYLKLCVEDIKDIFNKKKNLFKKTNCPACKKKTEEVFKKFSFSYHECSYCKTLFVNPRPSKKKLEFFYKNAKSVKFWSTNFYKETSCARKKFLWGPKIKLINNFFKEKKISYLIDIGAGYGDFLDLAKKRISGKTIAIEPSDKLALICQKKGHYVINKFLEDLTSKEIPNNKNNIFFSFELFEHVHNAEVFINKIYKLMKFENYLVLSTLSGTGMDIKYLRENSKSVFPPHHLNFFNPYSIELLFKKTGFKIHKIFTPGVLDLDIMKNNIDKINNNFWKKYLKNSSNSEIIKMQNFISNHNLSSHMWIICQK